MRTPLNVPPNGAASKPTVNATVRAQNCKKKRDRVLGVPDLLLIVHLKRTYEQLKYNSSGAFKTA